MKSKSTYIFIIAWVASAWPVSGRLSDTLHIPEVEIVKNRTDFYTEDLHITKVDSLLRQENPFLNLGELLGLTDHANVQTYGSAGSLASLSIRGLGSAHTNVLWNGMPLNSLTTGISDLSMIPVTPFSEISLAYGSSGSLYGAGAFGGSVTLDHDPDWDNRQRFQTMIEAGSHGSKAIHMDLETGNNTFQFKMSPFFQAARNDFLYEDSEKPDRPILRREHNFFQNYGVLQNLNIRLPRQQMLEFGFWYQVKYNQIPLQMGSYGQSAQSQTDSTVKVYLKWNQRFAKTSLEARMGYAYDYLRFTDRQTGPDGGYAIDSRISNKRAFFDVNTRLYQLNRLVIDVGADASLLAGSTGNYYDGTAREYRVNMVGSAKYSLDRMTINGSLRWHSDNFLKSKILYSLGVRWPVIPDRWMLRAHLSNRYRLPTFNDRYWHPGGNLDLLPETGWGTDIGSILGLLDAGIQHHRLQWQFSAHSTWVRNWIQWVPAEGYWSPVNFKEVWARGIESGLTYSYNREPLNFRAVVDYAWTRSAVGSAMDPDLKGTDLRYVPHHLIRSHLSVAFESFTTSIYYRYTGSRFTTDDNDPFYRLDPHHTFDLSTGYTLRDQIYCMTFRIKINNILNEQYQMVRGFPMPGRSFSIGIQFKFSNTAQ